MKWPFFKPQPGSTIRLIGLGGFKSFGQFWLHETGRFPSSGEEDSSTCHIHVLKSRNTSTYNMISRSARQHRKRRGQSEQYHRRIQKKWDQRFRDGDPRFAVHSDPKVLSINWDPSKLVFTDKETSQ